MRPLSHNQIGQFRDQGFLVVRQLVDAETVDALRSSYDTIIDQHCRCETPLCLVYIDEPSRQMTGWRSLPFYLGAKEIAGQLLGIPVGYREDQIIMKPAGYEGESPWHQDAAYWRRLGVEVPDAVVCWLALTPTSSRSSGLVFAPSLHCGELLEHSDVAAHYDLPEALECDIGEAHRVGPELAVGDATFHHYMTPHYSAGNATGDLRRAWTIHFWPRQLLETER